MFSLLLSLPSRALFVYIGNLDGTPLEAVFIFFRVPQTRDPDAGKDRGQEEKGTTEDEMVGWHH